MEGVDQPLDQVQRAELIEVIAMAAVAWRQALLGGRFDKALDRLTNLKLLIDDFIAKYDPEP